jgi:predicted alpha/beta hydrolase
VAKRTNVMIEASDGYPLEVTGYVPITGQVFSAVTVINSGAGIPKSLYEPFASWLADYGIPTLTYDYRGIGGSRSPSIRTLKASIRDWGSKDCAAVLRHASALYPSSVVHVVGHSIGGIVTGFVTSPVPLGRLLFLSPHTGYLGDYAPSARLRMLIVWHCLMPMLTSIFGYFPGRAFGLPEDLPGGVASEWGKRRFRWNLRSDVAFGKFLQVSATGLVIRPDDDLFATRSAMERVQSHYERANLIDFPVDATSYARKGIGHFGFFSPRFREALWPIALSWLVAGAVQTTSHPYRR